MHLGLEHAEKKKIKGDASVFDHIMIFIGLIGPLSLLPQVFSVWYTKDTAGISLLSWSLLVGVACMWVAYGIYRRSKALIVSNLLLAIFDVLVVIGVLMFR